MDQIILRIEASITVKMYLTPITPNGESGVYQGMNNNTDNNNKEKKE